MKLSAIAFLLALPVFAGQSLILSPGVAGTVGDPYLADNQSWRVEFQIHGWTPPPAGLQYAYIFRLNGTGVSAAIWPDGRMFIIDWRDTVSGGSFLGVAGRTNVLVRIQRDAPAMQLTGEIWNSDGSSYANFICPITSINAYPTYNADGILGTADTDVKLAFLRVDKTLVPLASKPPTTANAGTWTELRFDGGSTGLQDSSGNNHHASLSNPAYAPTPNQTPSALIKTAGAPSWSDWTSFRAGHPAQLDGSRSYSLADASDAVTYRWQQVGGPTVVRWSSYTAEKPAVEGLVFGTYKFRVEVMDAAGATATKELEVGAVATDDNGVVVNADSNVDKVFGPMIAFGASPWGYMDERALAATTLRKAVYEIVGVNGYSLANPSFIHDGAGTVSFIMGGVGALGNADTTLSAGINATDPTISVVDATKLDLTGLPETPVRICLSATGGGCNTSTAMEEVRICSASGNTLTVCYDGRGQNAQAWSSGARVGQYRITGTGTSFVSDAAVPICPAGAPGPAGRVIYSTGTVTMTAGSTAVTGAGTAWTTANGVTGASSVWMRVAATHSSGTPFIFWAYVSSVGGATSITLARAYPADADTGTFSYQIVQADARLWGLGYTRTDGSLTKTPVLATGCESETAGYGKQVFDLGQNTTTFSSKLYTFQDGLGLRSAYGPNFYGEGLAHRALYYRSGLAAALTAANEMDDNWVRAPEATSPGGSALTYGGAGIGAIANVLLNSAAQITWSDVRPYIAAGAIGAKGCNDLDARDSGYLQAMLALGANFDPDATLRAGWKAKLAAVLTRDQNCKQADNSWTTASLWGPYSPHLTLAYGSAVATGTGLTAANTGCHVTASGTGSATNGSATLTGAGFTSGSMIAVTGTRNGSPYTGFYKYSGTSSPLTLSALWPGDTGSVTWMIDSFGGVASIGESQNDPQLAKNWVCSLDSSTQITLQRNWDGLNSNASHIYVYGANGISGKGQQPYMLGIKTHAFTWASQNDDPTISAGYAALLPLAAGWIYSTGYDPEIQGMHYGRVYDMCEPYATAPAGSSFEYRQVGCNYGLNPASTRAGRVLTAEASSALRAQYEAVPTPTVKTWGDTAYGSVWGYPPYTTGGVYSDSNYVRDENSNGSLGGHKWTGFFFGMGMAHQWPAVRLGGVQPLATATASLDFDLASVASAAGVRVTVTQPSGARTEYSCSASPCAVIVDQRQGTHWVQMKYVSASGAVLVEGEPELLQVPCGR